MLERIGGVVVAVRDSPAACDTYAAVLGAERAGDWKSGVLGGRGPVLRVGDSEVWLAEADPGASGAVAEFLARWGEGLLAGIVTGDVDEVGRRLGPRASAEDGRVHTVIHGLPVVVVEPSSGASGGPSGPLSSIYEVTSLVGDLSAAAAEWSEAFGLDRSRFHDLRSEQYGYDGTLTLFDPPARLDRVELSQPYDLSKAMGRFFERRGPSPYMSFAECDDLPSLRARLDSAGARYAGGDEGASLFVHPSSLHGMLMGVSRTNVAWRWSGRPDLAG